jgi:MFS family permease
VLSLAGYWVVPIWQHWLAVIIGAFLFLAWSSFSLPATFTIVATSLKQTRHTMGVSVQSMVRRVPMMIGPLIGGWLISHFGWQGGVKLALLGSLALSVVTMIFQWRIKEPALEQNSSRTATPPAPRMSLFGVVKSFNPSLRELLVSDILVLVVSPSLAPGG